MFQVQTDNALLFYEAIYFILVLLVIENDIAFTRKLL